MGPNDWKNERDLAWEMALLGGQYTADRVRLKFTMCTSAEVDMR
jgi:hypothetical protein